MRISDSEWKERVENGTLPLRPFWTDSFLYPAEERMMGDLNHDGVVTAADAMIALQIAARCGYDDLADVDCDGRVTALDALMILRAAAGAISLGGG